MHASGTVIGSAESRAGGAGLQRGTAFAEFSEADKGALETGKLADVALSSQDIFTVPLPELPKTESRLTIVGGKIVCEAK